ncbi:hypothetical protein SCHPADRAFT_678021 [Schizopora paradoxa]|uniref:F-box domain-containing protein n=1 Tax=Schizopora paradoxa TaxID=27342 RepID=A0A0H2RBB6_9AGAM|nr:hypothetical protein SCHPADRAFT_678021 [Schizopora paradoxa]
MARKNLAIELFPDELLAKIFIEAVGEDPEISCLSRRLVPKKYNYLGVFQSSARYIHSTTNVKLSHVSHAFRIVALETPQLWANVSNLQSKEELEVYLHRSKQAGLGIHLLIDDPEFNIKDRFADLRVFLPQDFLDAILPHAHRWVGFEFRTGKRLDAFMKGVPQRLSALCKGLELPRLRTLSLSFPSPYYFDGGEGLQEVEQSERNLTKDFRFYETWNTPNLKHLSTTWHIPKATPGTRSLQSISINLADTYYPQRWDDRPLLSLLPFFAQLRRLSLRVGETIWNTVRETKPRLEFPSLDVFVLHMQDNQLQYYRIENYRTELQCFIMPNVKSMEIERRLSGSTEGDERVVLHDWILDLFNKENRFEELHHLRLVFHKTRGHDRFYRIDQEPFQNIFRAAFLRFPNLHHLFFEAPFTVMKSEGDHSNEVPNSLVVVRAPPLRTLTLQNCPSLLAEDINDVLSEVKDGANFDCFERLNVNWCPSANKSSVEGVVANDKLFWMDSLPDINEQASRQTSPIVEAAYEDNDSDGEVPFFYDTDDCSSGSDLSEFDVRVTRIVYFEKLADKTYNTGCVF